MLWRTDKGALIEINRHDFLNDRLYYTKLYQLKNSDNQKTIPKDKINTILSLLKHTNS
tara:strand:+ start:301 stop:474 length:174 start_codon:yes stop_codon:yes gene_type:complete